MGYYAKLKFSAQLSADAPLDLLEDLINGDYLDKLAIEKFGSLPNIYSVGSFPRLPIEHEFGNTDRWESVIESAKFDKKRKTIKVECDLKAYDGLYKKFTDWLKPYTITGSLKEMGEYSDSWIEMYFNTENKMWQLK